MVRKTDGRRVESVARQNSPELFCIEARLPDATLAEIAAAEAWDAGASGIEERADSNASTLLLLYTSAEAAVSVRAAVGGVAGAQVGEPTRVVAKDWAEEWRRGLDAVRVGERLVVRPSWIDARLSPAAVEIVIDPGQAFGTGGHVSTLLALEWIEALSHGEAGFVAASRILDVGTGTGVLALAALALGGGSAVGFDLDPEAGIAARRWALRNGLDDRFDVFVGPVEALDGPGFDWLLVNMLKREFLPIARSLARVTRPGGRAIFSGLLLRECQEVENALSQAGFEPDAVRTALDANSDEWCALLMTRA